MFWSVRERETERPRPERKYPITITFSVYVRLPLTVLHDYYFPNSDALMFATLKTVLAIAIYIYDKPAE